MTKINNMYDFIEGTIAYKHPTYVVINTAGVGYRIEISLQTYTQIEKLEKTRLLTYLNVKEDDLSLYGFASLEERKIFQLLIKVNGIGTNTARLILSSLTYDEVVRALQKEEVNTFKAVKGIGMKTAQRIIIDLKDKIDDIEVEDKVLKSAPTDNSFREEAFSALGSLGFQKAQIQKVAQKLKGRTDIQNVEQYIKEALKLLS